MSASRVAAALAVAVLAAFVGLGLRQPGWRPGQVILGESYDTLHVLAGGAAVEVGGLPVVVVYLDLRSFLAERVDPARPWPRELHAQLVRRLTAAGARAVVFDVVFGGAGPDPAADRDFAEAIAASGRVVLAGQASAGGGQMTDPGLPSARVLEMEAPHAPFASGAVAWGLANHRVDDDFVVRRHFAGFEAPSRPSLAWATAAWLGRTATRDGVEGLREANRRWIRYYGPAVSLRHVSYSDALRPGAVPDTVFRDRIVWIGARPMAGLFNERQDEFRSPFHSWQQQDLFLPGVEVHATEWLNLMRDDGLRRMSGGGEMAVLAGAALVIGLGLTALRPGPATVAALAGAGLSAWGAVAAFDRGWWFPWLAVVAGQIPIALVGAWLIRFREWHVTRRRLEAERRVAEARIREQAALIDKANDAILVHDLSGGVVYTNPSAARLYGGSPGDAPAEELAEAREKTRALGEWRGELHSRDRDGRVRVVESRWTLIRDEGGAPRAMLRIDADVTEKRQLEAESLRLQRAEAVGALASGMAHDLNNALAPVLMGAEILQRSASDDEVRRILGLMESGTRRGAEMVRQVLLFARGRQGERRRLDLRTLVKEMEKLARDTFPRNITITSHAPPDLWPVEGNPTEIHQVLLNLCVNARDAMPGGGSLDLVLDNVDLDAEAAAAIPGGRAGAFVSLLVADTGAGIPPEVMSRLFEPFFTTKPAGVGTGLGLSTTSRIARAHGGFVAVQSHPGEGTSFEVFFPRLATDGGDVTEASAKAPPRGRGEGVLVVDDEVAITELVCRGLEESGYRAVAARTGVEAVAVYRERPDAFALVLCDLGMAGLDGPGVVAELRAVRPDVPVLYLSGEGGRAVGRAGADPVLAKPFSLALLLGRIREVLEGRGDTGIIR